MVHSYIGKVVRVNREGLCLVMEEGKFGKSFAFRMDTVDGYSKEVKNLNDMTQFSLKGFVEGVIVKFTLSDEQENRVTAIQPLRWTICSDEIPGLSR